MEINVEYTTPQDVPSERTMIVGLKSDEFRRRKFDMALNSQHNPVHMAYNTTALVTLRVDNVKFVAELKVPFKDKVSSWHTKEFFCQLHGTHILDSGRLWFSAHKLHFNLTRMHLLDRIVAKEAGQGAALVENWFRVRRSTEPRVSDEPSEAPPPYPVSQVASQVATEDASEHQDAPWAKSDMTNKMRMMTQMINRANKYLDDTQAFVDEMRALKEVYEMYD